MTFWQLNMKLTKQSHLKGYLVAVQSFSNFFMLKANIQTCEPHVNKLV